MMLAILIAAASAASAGPVMPYAEARSVAYRECVAAERRRRPAATIAQIGRGACGKTRSRLFADVRGHLGYGWAATAKSAGQSKRMRAQLKRNAEEAVVRFEREVELWHRKSPPHA